MISRRCFTFLAAAVALLLVGSDAESVGDVMEDLKEKVQDMEEKEVDEIIADNVDKAQDEAETAEWNREDNDDAVQKSLDAAASSGVAKTTDWLVKQASNDTALPSEDIARNVTMLEAEAAVQRAREQLKVALANKKLEQKLLDDSKFQVAQAELAKAKAEKQEEKDAKAVAKNEHLDEGHSHWWPSATKTKREAKKDSIEEKIDADEKTGQVDFLASERDAGVISKKQFVESTADAPSRVSSFFMTLVYVLPVAALVGIALRYHHLKRRRLAVQEGVWLG